MIMEFKFWAAEGGEKRIHNISILSQTLRHSGKQKPHRPCPAQSPVNKLTQNSERTADTVW